MTVKLTEEELNENQEAIGEFERRLMDLMMTSTPVISTVAMGSVLHAVIKTLRDLGYGDSASVMAKASEERGDSLYYNMNFINRMTEGNQNDKDRRPTH